MRGARPARRFERAVEAGGAVRRGEHVLIACSGGPDSVALAAIGRAVAKPLQLRLTLAHVNHGVRASTAQDECVAAAVAASLDLPLIVERPAIPNASEASLRDARYAALVAAARACGAGAIAVAHHAEDQSETVLLALFRGSGSDGIAGMPARRELVDGIDLVRPLLRLSPDDLLRYCRDAGLPYAIDPTNANAALRRNAVREALAALRPLFPHLDEAVARAAELAADDRAGAGRAGLRRLVRGHLAQEKALTGVDFAHVEAAVRALEGGGTGTFHMKTGIRLEIRRGAIAGITRS